MKCKQSFNRIVSAPLMVAAWVFVIFLATPSFCDVNLGIGDDDTYKRPNSWSKNNLKAPAHNERVLIADGEGPASRPGMSIAWRNANQIEEVEVRVRNLGSEPGEGRLYVDILDEYGKVLLHLDPPDEQKIVRIPAMDRGGLEGKIIRMKANWQLNNLIDRFDRARIRYHVRGTIETIGKDSDPFDNIKVKSWNIPFRVRPGFTNVYNYLYRNNGDQPVDVKWVFEHTPYPAGWTIEGVPQRKENFTLKPGEEIHGALLMRAPEKIEEGAFVESRLSLADVKTGMPFQQNEWFQVYDTKPPQVSNYQVVLTDDHHVGIRVLVADKESGVLEATGVATEYSVDGGRTWSLRAHNYTRGNFVKPTEFETVLGPFLPGTNVALRFSASDTAGNVQGFIPEDAVVVVPPPNARELIARKNASGSNGTNGHQANGNGTNGNGTNGNGTNGNGISTSGPIANGGNGSATNGAAFDPIKGPGLPRNRFNDFFSAADLAEVTTFTPTRRNTPVETLLKMTTLEVKVR
jgi:hypothetical protein